MAGLSVDKKVSALVVLRVEKMVEATVVSTVSLMGTGKDDKRAGLKADSKAGLKVDLRDDSRADSKGKIVVVV
jgi:hypothetical protein